MKNINFKIIFPYSLIFVMGWFLYNHENLQAWICMGISTVLWLIVTGNDIKNGKSN